MASYYFSRFSEVGLLRRFQFSLLHQFLRPYARSFRDQIVEKALHREAAGEIIITPTRMDWKGEVLELAQKHHLLLVSLDEILRWEDDKFLPTPEWDEYLTAFCKMIECDLPSRMQTGPEVAPFEFRRKGQMWVVRFSGREMFLKDGVGPQHISVLLSQPGQSIYAVDLQMIATKQDTELARQWLVYNRINRPARPDVVRQYVQQIESGLWKRTHQGAAFTREGVLLDGQPLKSAWSSPRNRADVGGGGRSWPEIRLRAEVASGWPCRGVGREIPGLRSRGTSAKSYGSKLRGKMAILQFDEKR